MGGACGGTYGGEKINAYRSVGEGNLKERDYLENLVVDARKINLKVIGWEDVEWINLAQDRDK
jgi:hypothetical protein